MADYDSSLPVRTESPGDIDIFISDASTPTQKLKVNADGSVDTNFAAGSAVEITDGTDTLAINADGSINTTVSATDLDIRDLSASQDSVAISDGTETALVSVAGELQTKDDSAIALLTTIDADTSNLDVALSTRASEATLSTVAGDTTSIDAKLVDGNDIGDVTINNASGAAAVNIQDGGNSITVDAVDLDVRDLSSTSDSVEVLQATHDNLNLNANLQFSDADVTTANPLPVYIEENAGTELVDYNTTASVAAAASTNHDYTVPALTTFIGEELWASGSGKIKVEVLVNGATVFTAFNSTAAPNVRIPLEKIVKANAAEVVRITITNRDKQPQDVYSTLTGIERS